MRSQNSSPGRRGAGSRRSPLSRTSWLAGSLALGLFVAASAGARAAIPIPLGPPASAPPTLAFEADAVTATGLSPGGEAVLFALSREPQGYYTRVVPRSEVLVADAAGEARYELGAAVPVRSVWVLAEVASGALAVAAPEGFPLRARELSPGDLRRGPGGRRDRLVQALERLEVLVVRPGVGTWRLSLHDGGSADADGADDGALAAALAELVPVGAAPGPPEEVAAGDRFVAIDPATLDLFTLALPEGPGQP
jgi:hypothetical protein